MEVQVISSTVQKFDGESYYLCGYYYQRKGRRLHRAVWEYHHGAIPTGYHVHHADGNRSNNSIDNLVLLEGRDHLSEHMNKPDRREHSKRAIEIARKAASEWHGSEEGLIYHSKLGKESYAKRKVQTYECSFCGKEFQTKHVYPKGANRFCHQNCKMKFRTRRLRLENQSN